jgi:lipopolysaccharide assembly outer membrane protein LptD (OstA)
MKLIYLLLIFTLSFTAFGLASKEPDPMKIETGDTVLDNGVEFKFHGFTISADEALMKAGSKMIYFNKNVKISGSNFSISAKKAIFDVKKKTLVIKGACTLVNAKETEKFKGEDVLLDFNKKTLSSKIQQFKLK